MHTRRLAAFLLGAWIAGCVFMGFVAAKNFAMANGVAETAAGPASVMIKSLGVDSARQLLRYLASEENRYYFRNWERAQILVGLATLVSLAFATQRRVYPLLLCALMLALVLMQTIAVTPEVTYLGRNLDFAAAGANSTRDRFWVLHKLYLGAEGVKLLLGLGLATYLFWFRPRRRPALELDVVDHANHRHIDW
jgi:hypothetical protein